MIAIRIVMLAGAMLTADPGTVPYCDIGSIAPSSEGVPIRVRAWIRFGVEQQYLYDPDCGDDQERTWVDESTNWDVVAINQRVRRRLLRVVNESGEALVTITGTIKGPPPDSFLQRPYGHGSRYKYLIVVKSVDEIGRPRQVGKYKIVVG